MLMFNGLNGVDDNFFLILCIFINMVLDYSIQLNIINKLGHKQPNLKVANQKVLYCLKGVMLIDYVGLSNYNLYPVICILMANNK